MLDDDKNTLRITLTYDEVKTLSRNKFKMIIRSKVELFALLEFNVFKQKHSKSSYLHKKLSSNLGLLYLALGS